MKQKSDWNLCEICSKPRGRGRDHTAPRGFMHGGCVHTGANPHHQHRCPRLMRAGNQRAQELRRDMAQRMALGLQIVENGGLARTGCTDQRRAVDGPVQIGHHRHAIAYRSCGCHTDAIHQRNTGIGQILCQNRLKTGKSGVGKAADRFGAHHLAICKGDAGIGAANIGNDGEGGGHCGTS